MVVGLWETRMIARQNGLSFNIWYVIWVSTKTGWSVRCTKTSIYLYSVTPRNPSFIQSSVNVSVWPIVNLFVNYDGLETTRTRNRWKSLNCGSRMHTSVLTHIRHGIERLPAPITSDSPITTYESSINITRVVSSHMYDEFFHVTKISSTYVTWTCEQFVKFSV